MIITDKASKRFRELVTTDTPYVRITIEAGGCNGFNKSFSLESEKQNEDFLIDDVVVVDEISWSFLENSVVDFVTDTLGQHFSIQIPDASSQCGCGNSFGI